LLATISSFLSTLFSPRDTKTLRGFGGAGVVEVVTDFRGDTFRAVYTLRYAGAIYVLHAFQEKSKSGRATPRRDIELIGTTVAQGRRNCQGEEP